MSVERQRKTTFASLLRCAAAVLLGTSMVMAGWPSCDTNGSPVAQVDREPTFGAEFAVSVLGAGSVTSYRGELSCPGKCFARILLEDSQIDGSAAGVQLTAEAALGSHFVRWKLDALDLGIRAPGPPQCSPMLRATTIPDPPPVGELISLHFGETNGVPPKGREAECADFTRVPVAYAITAVFAPNFRDVPDAAPPREIVYDPPPNATGRALDIGIAGGFAYWRYEPFLGSSQTGIATGVSALGPQSAVAASPEQINSFDVDKHVVFQTSAGTIKVIEAGAINTTSLGVLPFCAALASDSTNAYCRAAGATTSSLFALPIGAVASPTTVHTLPLGRDLAVDETTQKFYFSDDPGSFIPGAATVESAPRLGDGGMPAVTPLVFGQTSPHSLLAGQFYLFWLDDRGGFPVLQQTTAATKFNPSDAGVGLADTSVRFIAADPVSDSYWVGLNGGNGNCSIVKVQPGNAPTTIFRSSLPSLNGLAVDTQYVYWTQDDGHVYRAPKFSGGGGGGGGGD